MGLRCPVYGPPSSFLALYDDEWASRHRGSFPQDIPLVRFSLLRHFSSSTGSRRSVVCKPPCTSFNPLCVLSHLDPSYPQLDKKRAQMLNNFSYKRMCVCVCQCVCVCVCVCICIFLKKRFKCQIFYHEDEQVSSRYISNIEWRKLSISDIFATTRACNFHDARIALSQLFAICDEIITWTIYNNMEHHFQLFEEVVPCYGYTGIVTATCVPLSSNFRENWNSSIGRLTLNDIAVDTLPFRQTFIFFSSLLAFFRLLIFLMERRIVCTNLYISNE